MPAALGNVLWNGYLIAVFATINKAIRYFICMHNVLAIIDKTLFYIAIFIGRSPVFYYDNKFRIEQYFNKGYSEFHHKNLIANFIIESAHFWATIDGL